MAAIRNLRFILTGEDKSASKALAGVTKQAKGFQDGIGRATKYAAVGLAGVGVAAVKSEAQFSATMNQMAAVAGVPAKGIEELSALAMKMGADTVYSASAAGDAMLELAKGGLTAAQIQAGALAATLTLASAGGLELGAAATFMSNAMNTFGLAAKDAEKVAAALAGGANASTASVESLGQALSQVGPGAKTAGLSLEETVAVLAAFDNAGIKGSDAGTSLKTMLTRLVPQSDKAATAMERIGLQTTNADGSFRDIADIAEQLRKGLTKLSDKQRTYALSAIFGSDATRAATVLMGEGRVGVEKYIKATSDLGAAQRVADSRMKGTAGSIEQLKGSLETAGLAIGQMLAPFVQKAAKGLTELANGFTRNKDVVVPLVGILAGFAATVWTINKAVAAGKAITAAYTAVKWLLVPAQRAEAASAAQAAVATNALATAETRAGVAGAGSAAGSAAAAAGFRTVGMSAATAALAVGKLAAAFAAAYAAWELSKAIYNTATAPGGGSAGTKEFQPFDPYAPGGSAGGENYPVPSRPTTPQRGSRSYGDEHRQPRFVVQNNMDSRKVETSVSKVTTGKTSRGYLAPGY